MAHAQTGSRHEHTVPDDLAVAAENVHVTYDDGTEAVRGVDLSVAEGEFFGFLGPNGAGKTTTVRTLVTLLHPTRGSVRINGYDTRTEPQAVRESIGYMAQETSIDLELTPRENLRVACEMYGVPAAQRSERIDRLLDLVDLRDVEARRAETFSGGMRKRLDTATVLVHRPPVVFLDEPTTGLDPEARRRVWDYIERINDRGTTVFLTTQYLEEADRLCDRLALLEDGQVTARGTPDALKATAGTARLAVELADATDRERRRLADALRASSAFEAATVERTAEGLAVETSDVDDVVQEVFAALCDASVGVTGLDVGEPTLDDVFFALTDGREPGGDGRSDDAVAPMEAGR
ncbi:ATP-binding cassette domain-containing protein [Haloarcula sp. S1CR25-12]|uniref:ATP-binding cassette domain-containing protein n=1 Tax=Haloarcula saliterrae TaxID=2950534 RepID=A0ABU2FFE3_9EURY|nr:ATP-binding cassette domain-containing protein [Haloarcula sp. S1CR25-12]MDS0260451.1 ATP-binding cassette domain-containing protein [Haloarcula sp. S1CR25-12]